MPSKLSSYGSFSLEIAELVEYTQVFSENNEENKEKNDCPWFFVLKKVRFYMQLQKLIGTDQDNTI